MFGIIYFHQANYPKAIEYYLKSLKIRQGSGNKKGMGDCYSNIGNVYSIQADFPKALEYYFKSLEIRREIGDTYGIGTCYINIGFIYENQFNHNKALAYFIKALKISKELGNKQGIEICYFNIGESYNYASDFKSGIQYCDSALLISKEIGDLESERNVYGALARTYAKLSKYKEAYENHVKFKVLTDSIFNAENSKQLGDMKTRFEVEKKETELKARAKAQEAISAEEKKRQRFVIYSVAGVLLLVIVFSAFLFNRFRITRKQKKVIEEQKVLVDKAYENLHEKNKEVLDSIHYARRIQTALITSEKYIARQLGRLRKN